MAEPAATFAFVDLAGPTTVTGVHGEREAVALLPALRARVQEALGPEDELVKTIGDAMMLRFRAPTDAVAALRAVLRRERTTPGAVLLPRIGAHHGPAVAVGGDYYGATVNLASRVAGCAKPGQLLVTSDVALAAQQLGALVTRLGTPEHRHASDHVDLWDVRVDTASPMRRRDEEPGHGVALTCDRRSTPSGAPAFRDAVAGT